MSRNYYSEINLHITWHTKNSLPLLNDKIEPLAHHALKKRLLHVDGILVQLPLPVHIDEPAVITAIDPAKDADGCDNDVCPAHDGCKPACLAMR